MTAEAFRESRGRPAWVWAAVTMIGVILSTHCLACSRRDQSADSPCAGKIERLRHEMNVDDPHSYAVLGLATADCLRPRAEGVKQGVAIIDGGLKRFSQSAYLHWVKGRIFGASGNSQAQHEEFEEVIRLANWNVGHDPTGRATVDDKRLLAKLNGQRDEAAQLEDLVMTLLSEQKCPDAMGELEKRDPRSSPLWYELMVQSILECGGSTTGGIQQALQLVEEGLGKWPKSASLLSRKADLYDRLGDAALAVATYEQARSAAVENLRADPTGLSVKDKAVLKGVEHNLAARVNGH